MADAIALVPPNNQEAEQSVLACLLYDSGLVPIVQRKIVPADMYREGHKAILAAIYELHGQGKPTDMIAVANHLGSRLDAAGGYGYLVDLANSIPTTAHAEYYADIVADKAQARRLRQHGQRVINITAEDIPAAEMREQITASLIAVPSPRVSSLEGLKAIGERYLEEAERRMEEKRALTGCLEWGLYDLDNAFVPAAGELIIIAGRPAMGKTAFAFQLARIIATRSPVLCYSLEMSKEALYMRFVQEITGIPVKRQRGVLSYDEYKRISDAYAILSELDLRIDDNPNLTVETIRADALQMVAQGEKPPLILIDYMQLMEAPSDGKRRLENRTLELGSISRGLKKVAREIGCVVFALSQLSRAVESRTDKRPMLSDLRESGNIEQDADIVIFLYREEYYNPETAAKGVAEVILAKNRQGAVSTVKMGFDAPKTRFYVLGYQSPGYEEVPV